jgi:hypothetical protein
MVFASFYLVESAMCRSPGVLVMGRGPGAPASDVTSARSWWPGRPPSNCNLEKDLGA